MDINGGTTTTKNEDYGSNKCYKITLIEKNKKIIQ